jgi:hypothetical protein
MSDADDYDVGYGKPPASTRFKTGQSGNPAGRKKGSTNLAAMVRGALDEKVAVNIGGKRRRVSKLEAAFIQQSNKAAGGDLKAIKLMIDILNGAQSRETAVETVSPEVRRQRSQQALAALKARLTIQGGGDGKG